MFPRPTTTIQPKMVLHVARTTPVPPFHHTGMGYCGPFTARVTNFRRSAKAKVYLCIFICFAWKEVLFEVAQDLTTDMFLDVLQRFIIRRGATLHLYLDCGTNFMGASRRLQGEVQRPVAEESNAGRIKSLTHPRGILFHFNPPATPHQWPLWERMVRLESTI
jgi:hypothetical protein